MYQNQQSPYPQNNKSGYMGSGLMDAQNYDDLDESLLRNQSNNPKTNRTSMSQVPGNVDLAEMDIELFNRLLKVGVIRVTPNIKTLHEKKIVVLDAPSTIKFQNGVLFGNYLLVLKEVLAKVNQEFSIDKDLANTLKDQNTPQVRLYNWNFLCNELDKIGIIIENDIKSLYVAGDSEEIGKLFARIERYMKRISGDNEILNFTDYRKDDRKAAPDMGDVMSKSGRRGFQSSQKKAVKDGVDIMQMDISKEPSQTESTLEFILNTLCRALSMKPKQSAALLTNNNQFLTHCVVKGVKGRYEPMISWYHEMYQYSRHLSMMLEAEVENAQSTKDPKVMKASAQNFDKVLQTISCGCYSNNFEVAQICLKTLSCVAQDFNGNVDLLQLTMKWFQSKDNGIYTMNYAYKKHPDLAEDFVSAIGNFTGGGEQMSWVYSQVMQQFYPDMIDYFNTTIHLFPYLALKYSNELQNGNLLSQLIEKCCSFADNEYQNSPQLRMSAISLLNEIWLNFSPYIDKNQHYVTPIQHVYNKNSRDQNQQVRIVTVTCMFKLLDKFSEEKNASAPSIYKALIFSLVENPQDQTVRELFLTNFQYLFERVKQIPVGLLIDPLVKSNQVQDTFIFQSFDYEFFSFLSQHPKLNIQNAIQMLDLLARQYLNDINNAENASVPFMMICNRFMGTLECQEFILKFITICLNQLLQLEGSLNEDLKATPPRQGSKQLALPAPPANVRGSSTGPQKKEYRISSSKKSHKRDMIMNRKQTQEEKQMIQIRKQFIIQILLKLQNLRQEQVNNAMRDMLLSAQKQYKEQNNGYLHDGIMDLLKYWGDPDLIFNQYLKRQEKLDSEERKAYESLQKQQRKMLGYESDDKRSGNHRQAPGSLGASKSTKSLKPTVGRNSLALLPITENAQNLRAMHELEAIKKFKRDKLEEENLKHQSALKKQTQKEKALQEALKKRRVEQGVHQNKGGVKQEIKALIYNDQSTQQKAPLKQFKNPIDSHITLIDINDEEDRDRELIIQFMKKNAKIWKFLFARYANSCYSTKGRKDFDDLGQKTHTINLAEVTKMLREHNTYPTLLSKEEIATLVRLINLNSAEQFKTSSDLQMLEYPQFIQFVPQLAFFCFSRPPIDKSHFPPIESLNSLLHQFEEATRERGKSTALYEDPDASSFADKELIQALEERVNENPSYPLPEGYKKQQEKIPKYSYKVPDCAKAVIRESQLVATEVMDQLLFEALGVHFLEPQVSFDIKYKVKQAISKQKKPPAEALSYMKKVEKKVEEKQANATSNLTPAERRRLEMEVKPKINLALKFQVAKQDLKSRPHYQEVAETFEEMLQGVEKGLEELPPRQNRAPGQVENEAKKEKYLREQEEALRAQEQELRRKIRDDAVKKKIKDTKYGGREMPINKYKKLQAKVEKEEQEKLDREERKEFQAQAKLQKEEVDLIKAKNLEELKKKREEEEKKADIEKKMADKIRQTFLAKQKAKLKGGFNDTYKKRDDIILRQEEQKKLEKANEARLKEQMSKYIKDTKEDREIEKKERKDIIDFIKKPDVKAVFDQYQKQLFLMYKFYASQDNKKDASTFDIEFLHSVLSFQEMVRFGYQQNLTPGFISPDDMVHIYKNLVREQQDDEGVDKKVRGSAMIDYTSFKKAIVRISIMAQEKLGQGANEDALKKKLERDSKANQEYIAKRDKFKEKQKIVDKKKQDEKQMLKEQFQEEQKYIANQTSKANKNEKPETNKKEPSLAEQKRAIEKQYQLDQAKLQQEEEFFQKWLKQRENLGLLDQKADELTQDDPMQSQRTLVDANKKLLKKKDMTQKELDDLEKQLAEQKRVKNLKVEQKQIRKQLDVSIISAATIQALINFLGLTDQDTEWDVNRKLNETMANRKTISKAGQQSPKNGYKLPVSPQNADLNDRA